MGYDRDSRVTTLVSGLAENYCQSSDPDETVREAQRLARKAHYETEAARAAIDRSATGRVLRLDVIDPLLHREREIRALRLRMDQGGSGRACDALGLERILALKEATYDELVARLDWDAMPRSLKFQVSQYVEARRRSIRFGDAEQIRRQAVTALQQAV